MSNRNVKFGIEAIARGPAGAPVPTWIRQVHGNAIVEAAATIPAIPPAADGVFTAQVGRRVSVLTADCVPLLLYDEETVVAIHCGWRGALSGIARKGLDLFPEPARVRAVVGPAIGPCCFEVRDDFVAAFRERGRPYATYLQQRDGKLFFDLPAYVHEAELAALDPDQIDLSQWRCTFCSEPRLPSFRRDGNTDLTLRTWIERGPSASPTHPNHPGSSGSAGDHG